MNYIVTDLTRLSKEKQTVCLAGISPEENYCIRPIPYLTDSEYIARHINPGVTLNIEPSPNPAFIAHAPHIEDFHHNGITVVRAHDPVMLHGVLTASACGSISDGFGLQPSGKYFPADTEVTPLKSIITLALSPQNFSLAIDNYGKTKAHFVDGNFNSYTFMPVADLGINKFIESYSNTEQAVDILNTHFKSQQELFLRIGFGRAWKNPNGVNGFWLQVNAAHSFPNLPPSINSY